MESCDKCFGLCMLIVGIVFILARLYTTWDIWVVIGVILIVKGILITVKIACPHCQVKPAAKKK